MGLLDTARLWAVFAAVFAVAGFCLEPLERAAGRPMPLSESPETVRAAVGAGAVFEVLGGYASLAADFAWIKGYVDWTRKDIPACTASMELAVALDPHMKQFWRDAAAIVAFDYPHWKLAGGGNGGETAEALRLLKIRYGRDGIKFADRGLKIFPDDESLLIQKASIAMANLDDYATAEECYAKMAAKKDAPVYILRRYAALLMRNGKFAEAVKAMERMDPEIPEDSPLKATVRRQLKEARRLMEKSKL